jgi:hypothetical protein
MVYGFPAEEGYGIGSSTDYVRATIYVRATMVASKSGDRLDKPPTS